MSIATKNKILEVSQKLFFENGIANTRLQQIADEAGISAGHLAYHFKNKEAVVTAVYEQVFKTLFQMFNGEVKNMHVHTTEKEKHEHTHLHKISFGVGIIHGLAGSGVLIAAAMAAMQTVGSSLLFLIIFSIGCIAGMMVAAGILGLPFSRKLQSFVKVQQMLVVTSCIICVVPGGKIMMDNWFN